MRNDAEKDIRGQVFRHMCVADAQIDEAIHDGEVSLIEKTKRVLIQIARAVKN